VVRLARLPLWEAFAKFFGRTRLDLELKGRFGGQVEPQEWFLVPLPVIAEYFEKIRDGSLDKHRYDLNSARLIKLSPGN